MIRHFCFCGLELPQDIMVDGKFQCPCGHYCVDPEEYETEVMERLLREYDPNWWFACCSASDRYVGIEHHFFGFEPEEDDHDWWYNHPETHVDEDSYSNSDYMMDRYLASFDSSDVEQCYGCGIPVVYSYRTVHPQCADCGGHCTVIGERK